MQVSPDDSDGFVLLSLSLLSQPQQDALVDSKADTCRLDEFATRLLAFASIRATHDKVPATLLPCYPATRLLLFASIRATHDKVPAAAKPTAAVACSRQVDGTL